MTYYRTQLYSALVAEQIPANARVLSIGAAQDDQQYFKKRIGESVDWQTLDNDPTHRPNIQHDMNRPIVDTASIAFEEADGIVDAFDVVLALELWEYIHNPTVAHENIATMLKHGGTYYGSYPFVYPTHRPVAHDMLRYTEAAIRKYAALNFLEIVWLQPRVSLSQTLGSFFGAEGMKSAPQLELGDAQRPVSHEVVGWVVKAVKR